MELPNQPEPQSVRVGLLCDVTLKDHKRTYPRWSILRMTPTAYDEFQKQAPGATVNLTPRQIAVEVEFLFRNPHLWGVDTQGKSAIIQS